MNNRTSEPKDQGISSWNKILATFFCIITIRIFLDSFAFNVSNGKLFLWEHYIHALLYFFSIFLSFAILLFFLTKENFKIIFSFLSKVSTTILLVPVISLLLFQERVSSFYVNLGERGLLGTFFELGNPLSNIAGGTTIGLYSAAFLTLICFYFFIYKKTGSIKKGLLAIFIGYCIFFLQAILPNIFLYSSQNYLFASNPGLAQLQLLKQSWIGKDLILDFGNLEKTIFLANSTFELVMAHIYWILIALQSFLVLFLSNKTMWHTFRKNMRVDRIVNYALIAMIGVVLSEKVFGNPHLLNPINTIGLFCFLLLLGINAWLAVFINDIEDYKIDAISNPERPLLQKNLSLQEWIDLHKYLFAIFILGLFVINKYVAFTLILWQCAYFIYSSEPLRLKKHFIFSSLLMGLTTTITAMGGFFLVSPNQSVDTFPIKALIVIAVSYALLSNIKDLKDYHGDKAANMKTIPVVFGLKKSRIIIACFYFLVFFSIPFILSVQNLLLFSIPASVFVFYIIIKNKHEKFVFFTKFAYMILLYIATK